MQSQTQLRTEGTWHARKHPHWTVHCSKTVAIRCSLQTVKNFIDAAFLPLSLLSDLQPWASREGCVTWNPWPILPPLDPISHDLEKEVGGPAGRARPLRGLPREPVSSQQACLGFPSNPAPHPRMSREVTQSGPGELGKGPSPTHLLFPIFLPSDFNVLTFSCSF